MPRTGKSRRNLGANPWPNSIFGITAQEYSYFATNLFRITKCQAGCQPETARDPTPTPDSGALVLPSDPHELRQVIEVAVAGCQPRPSPPEAPVRLASI
jgi:hypothetical protein